MKKTILLFLCLAFVSLACLSTAAGSSLEAVEEQEPSQVSTMADQTIDEAPLTMAPTLVTDRRCAVVVAVESLHLRGSASENGEVLTWLKSGVVVELVSDANPEWWRVKLGDVEGFARSTYLRESECVK